MSHCCRSRLRRMLHNDTGGGQTGIFTRALLSLEVVQLPGAGHHGSSVRSSLRWEDIMRGLRLMPAFRRCRAGRGISLCVVALAGVGVVLALSGTAVAAVSTGFIENRGQLDDEVLYYARGGGASIYFTAAAVVIDLREELEVASGHRGPGLGHDGHRFLPGHLRESAHPERP